MPTYCFKHPKTNKIIDMVFPVSSIPECITLDDGTVCERCVMAEIKEQNGLTAAEWPIHSHALAVHPSQRKEYEEFSEKHGVKTDFDEKGKPVFRTRKHRKEYCKLIGALDLDGGYGDAT